MHDELLALNLTNYIFRNKTLYIYNNVFINHFLIITKTLFFSKEKKSVILLHHGVQNYIMYIHLLVYFVTLESIIDCYLLHFKNASVFCNFHRKNYVSLEFLYTGVAACASSGPH